MLLPTSSAVPTLASDPQRACRHAPLALKALPLLLLAAMATLGAAPVHAASFTVDAPSTAAQTLGSASGQTGTVTAAGSLTVAGSAVAVTVTGNNATLTNLGAISQTGTGRAIRDNTGVTGLVVDNGSASNATASIRTADADVIQLAKTPASVTVNNHGSMTSLNASAGGSQVIDFNAIQSGANVVNNFAGASMTAYEADAVRPGVNGVVNNAGTIRSITATGSSSDGIDLQANTGVVVNNAATGLVEGGRHGITGGPDLATTGFAFTLVNDGTVRGANGSGINLDGFGALQTATLTNRGAIIGNGVTGDGDGVDVDGPVTVVNTGIIRSTNAVSPAGSGLAYSEGVSVGGGTITNSGTIEGLVAAGNTNAVGRGITLAGNDITSGALAGTREGLYANAVVVNLAGGTIRGQTDSAIAVTGAKSGFTVTIDNRAGGSIVGGGGTYAAIRSGADDDPVRNAGSIDGSSSGRAIDMGAGNNTLIVTGGAASIKGNVDGGVGGVNTLTIDAGAGNRFAYADSLSHFASVEVKSGDVTFSGTSVYSGATVVSGGTLVLDGANRLDATSSLTMNGGTLRLANAGAIGQTFASLSLLNSSAIDLGFSALTFNGLGTVASGALLSFSNALAFNGYAFRFTGDYSGNADFAALLAGITVDGQSVNYRFDGTYTDVGFANVSPVPEPATYALMLAGLCLIWGTRSKQVRRVQVPPTSV
jgi:autotransporter-associated beta strand protein